MLYWGGLRCERSPPFGPTRFLMAVLQIACGWGVGYLCSLPSVLNYAVGICIIGRDVYVRSLKMGYNEAPQGCSGR